jgi:hypothetical protein
VGLALVIGVELLVALLLGEPLIARTLACRLRAALVALRAVVLALGSLLNLGIAVLRTEPQVARQLAVLLLRRRRRLLDALHALVALGHAGLVGLNLLVALLLRDPLITSLFAILVLLRGLRWRRGNLRRTRGHKGALVALLLLVGASLLLLVLVALVLLQPLVAGALAVLLLLGRVLRGRVLGGRILRRRILRRRILRRRILRRRVLRRRVLRGRVLRRRVLRGRVLRGRVLRGRVLRGRVLRRRVAGRRGLSGAQTARVAKLHAHFSLGHVVVALSNPPGASLVAVGRGLRRNRRRDARGRASLALLVTDVNSLHHQQQLQLFNKQLQLVKLRTHGSRAIFFLGGHEHGVWLDQISVVQCAIHIHNGRNRNCNRGHRNHGGRRRHRNNWRRRRHCNHGRRRRHCNHGRRRRHCNHGRRRRHCNHRGRRRHCNHGRRRRHTNGVRNGHRLPLTNLLGALSSQSLSADSAGLLVGVSRSGGSVGSLSQTALSISDGLWVGAEVDEDGTASLERGGSSWSAVVHGELLALVLVARLQLAGSSLGLLAIRCRSCRKGKEYDKSDEQGSHFGW